MLVFDPTEKTARSVWRTYQPGVRVRIRPITRVRMRELRRRAAAIRKRTGETLDAVLDRLIYRHIVDDWEGFVDPGGRPLPPTDDIVDRVTTRFNDFADWLADEALALAETLAAERAAALKKPNASPGGSTPPGGASGAVPPAGSSGN